MSLKRAENARPYDLSWRRYVRPVEGTDNLRIAPFHVMASEDVVHSDKPHDWHMSIFAELAAADPALLVATQHHVLDLSNELQVAAITAWWEAMTAAEGEGMVVKPLDFVARGKKGTFATGDVRRCRV